MKPIKILLLMSMVILVFNCKTNKYITDYESAQRQKMMQRQRTGENFADAAIQIGAIMTGVTVSSGTDSRSYRKLKLKNNSADTLFVNMITDYPWRDSSYCDVKDIILPPFEKVKLLTPYSAAYNVYYRNDFNAAEDDKIEINTAKERIVRLGKTEKRTKE